MRLQQVDYPLNGSCDFIKTQQPFRGNRLRQCAWRRASSCNFAWFRGESHKFLTVKASFIPAPNGFKHVSFGSGIQCLQPEKCGKGILKFLEPV